MDDSPTLTDYTSDSIRWASLPSALTALVVAWCRDESNREGEVLLMPGPPLGGDALFGRGQARSDDPYPRLTLIRFYRGRRETMPPLGIRRISRVQLLLRPHGMDAIEVANIGRCPLLHNGEKVSVAVVQPNDTLQLGNELLLICVRRPVLLPSAGAATTPSADTHPFGEADDDGIVGESPAICRLREEIAFLAPRAEHVLILGASGTGKELVARALHRRSARGEKPLVSRNAATFPESLVAAELYGNAKNFPNPGMSDRIGLIGEADGSTLFLDEFAELPAAVQAQLLRVLDAGEYQRLGESHNRRSDFRLVAATNRPIEALRPDIAARFTFRIEVPDLNARREDIPLLVRHILRGITEQDPDAAQRVFAGRGPNSTPVIPCELMRTLLQYDYSTHVRELRGRLWQALVSKVTGSTPATPMARSTSSNPPSGYPVRRSTPPPSRASTPPPGRRSIPPPAGYSAPPPSRRSVPPPSSRGYHEGDLTAADIQACLDRHNGVQTHAWRELGLSSRHALARLIVKHGLVVRRNSRRARRSDTRSGRPK